MTIWAVVPTCRGFTIPAQTVPVSWVIVHDRERRPIEGYATADLVAPDADLFGAGSDSIRSAGFAYAYRHGARGDVILTVDDDCRLPTDWAEQHLRALSRTVPLWSYTVPGLLTRGTSEQQLPVAISHGLWDGIPDVYARDQDGTRVRMTEPPAPIHPPFAQSSMNLGFWLEVTPVLYQPAQGPQFGMDRFADIWAGVLAQRCLVGRWGFLNGAATVYHERASDREVNRVKEAPGLAVHERFWRHVWQFRPVADDPLPLTYRKLATHVRQCRIDPYFEHLATRMERWITHLGH